MESSESLVLSCNRQAMDFLRQGQPADCLALLRRAQNLLAARPDASSRLLAITLNNLGCYFKKTGKLKTSLKYLNQALNLELAVPADRLNLAGTHLNITAIRSCFNQHELALQHTMHAITLLHEADVLSPSTETKATLAIAYYNAGLECESLTNILKAKEMYWLGLEIARKYLAEHPVTRSLQANLSALNNGVAPQRYYFTPIGRPSPRLSLGSSHSSCSPERLPSLRTKNHTSFDLSPPKRKPRRPKQPELDKHLYAGLERRIHAMQRDMAALDKTIVTVTNPAVQHRDMAALDKKIIINPAAQQRETTTLDKKAVTVTKPAVRPSLILQRKFRQFLAKRRVAAALAAAHRKPSARSARAESIFKELAPIPEARTESTEGKILLIQAHIRRFLAQRRTARKLKAVVTLQSFLRMKPRQMLYKDIYEAVLFIQRVWRLTRK